MLVRRAEIKDIEKINELLLQVAMVHHYGRPDLFKANCRKYKNDELVEIVKDDNRPIFVVIYDYVKKYAKEIGCYNLTLNVWSCNESAQKFYEKQGLKPQKTTMEMIL